MSRKLSKEDRKKIKKDVAEYLLKPRDPYDFRSSGPLSAVGFSDQSVKVSRCCRAPLNVAGHDADDTLHYVCTRCAQPTDPCDIEFAG